MRSYETARTLFGFLEFIAWAIVIAGVIAAILIAEGLSRYASGGELFVSVIPGMVISLLGLIFVAIVQTARASVDTAEYTQQMLKIARDQLEVSQQALRGAGHQVPGFASAKSDLDAKSGFKASDFRTDAKGDDKNAEKSVQLEAPEPLAQGNKTSMHQGQTITLRNFQYFVGESSFQTLDLAKKHIEQAVRIENNQ